MSCAPERRICSAVMMSMATGTSLARCGLPVALVGDRLLDQALQRRRVELIRGCSDGRAGGECGEDEQAVRRQCPLAGLPTGRGHRSVLLDEHAEGGRELQ